MVSFTACQELLMQTESYVQEILTSSKVFLDSLDLSGILYWQSKMADVVFEPPKLIRFLHTAINFKVVTYLDICRLFLSRVPCFEQFIFIKQIFKQSEISILAMV